MRKIWLGLAFVAIVAAQSAPAQEYRKNSATNAAPFGAYAGGPGSLMRACRPPCGVQNNLDFVPPHARKCVFTCINAKLAAQR